MTLERNSNDSAPMFLFSCESNSYTYLRSVFMINAILNGVSSVPIVVCNVVVLMAIWKTRSLRNPSNILICALASTDCCVGLLQPLYVTVLCSYFKDIMHFSVKCLLLRINKGLTALFAQMSFLVFTAISIDRFLMLFYSLSYSNIVTNERVYFVLAFSLLVSVILSFLNVFYLVTYGVIVVLLDFICIIISLLSYVKIYRTVKRHQIEIHNQTCAVASVPNKDEMLLELVRFKRRTKSMIVLYSAFLMSYLPFLLVVVLVGTIGEQWELSAATLYGITIVLFNSLWSPLLICWTLKDIRNAVLSLFFVNVQNEGPS